MALSSPTTFADLPREIKQEILKELDPLDISSIALTCKDIHALTGKNFVLYKSVYNRLLDEPSEPYIPRNWDWKEQLVRFVRFRRALGDGGRVWGVGEKALQLENTEAFISHLLRTASPNSSHNTALLSKIFENKSNHAAYLTRSSTFARAAKPSHTPPATTPSQSQLSAKLHCLYGVPIESPSRTHYYPVYPFAVSVVYDLRRYTEGTFWGPFMDDGKATVDWEKMEAVMVVLGHNLRLFVERTRNTFREVWRTPWVGASPGSFVPVSVCDLETPKGKVDEKDPYNVEGSWMRIVCFLDFHDLFAYNFASPELPAHEPRPDLDITEAIRLIIMELKVTKIKPVEGSTWPVVHFNGVSRSMHTMYDPNANSNIRGTVSMTEEGEVRWTTYSVYSGQERWKSEGIQIGGPDSGRGVLGHWFDKDLDEHGPAGPTAFWKVSNEIDERKEQDHWDSESLEDLDDYVETSDEELADVQLVVGSVEDDM